MAEVFLNVRDIKIGTKNRNSDNINMKERIVKEKIKDIASKMHNFLLENFGNVKLSQEDIEKAIIQKIEKRIIR